MPRFQDRVSKNNIDQYEPKRINKDDLTTEIENIDAVLDLTDAQFVALSELGVLSPTFSTVDEMRAAMTNLREKKQQRIRLWELDTQPITYDNLVPTLVLFKPKLSGSVVSVCGEEVGLLASNVLQNGGKWGHDQNHSHEIVLDLGNSETIGGVGVDIDLDTDTQHKLRSVDVYAAKSVGGLNRASNMVLSGTDFATEDSDNLATFAQKKARYVKFTNIDTDDGSNSLKVKAFKVRVVPKFFGED